MKRPIHYAIRVANLYGRTEIVAVTLERSGHWWGRVHDTGISTHGRTSDIDGRFETVEAALAVRDEVARVRAYFQAQTARLEEARQRLTTARDAVVRQVVTGHPQRGARMLAVVVSIVGDLPTNIGDLP